MMRQSSNVFTLVLFASQRNVSCVLTRSSLHYLIKHNYRAISRLDDVTSGGSSLSDTKICCGILCTMHNERIQ